MKSLSSLLFLYFMTQTFLFGQQSIEIDTSTYTVEELVRDVLIQSECAEVSNVRFIGEAAQIGYFSKGKAAIDFEDGIILSTGRVHDAVGPNEKTNTETVFQDVAHVGDEDLRQVANVGVNNLLNESIIEFDFVPLEDHIEFEFVFASEEYCEYAGGSSIFNDVFGFFLSGPGIAGPYSNNGINIARSPGGGNDNITVFNINHNVNYQYFIDNTPQNQPQILAEHIETCKLITPRDGITSVLDRAGQSVAWIEYDGFTVTLKAESNVIPLETYRLRIGVGDVNDGTWDSAVFLKAGSFKAGQPTAIITTPDTLDCVTTQITIDASQSSTGKGTGFTYNWTTTDGNIVSGANGYLPLVNQPGTYQLIVGRDGTSCADTATVEVVFNDERPEIQGALSGILTCTEPSTEIDIVIENPTNFTYQVEYPTATVSPLQNDTRFSTNHAGWHNLIALSANGCRDEFMHFVDIDTFAGLVNLTDYSFTCRDEEVVINPNFESLGFPFSFNWQTSNGTIVSAIDSNIVSVGQPGDYIFTASHATNGCSRAFEIEVVSDEIPPTISAGTDTKLDCQGTDIIPDASLTDPLGDEVITWSSVEGVDVLPGADDLHPIIVSPGNYILTVEKNNGCISTDTIYVAPADDAPAIEFLQADTLTCILESGIVDITITSDYETINWFTDDGDIDVVSADGQSISVNSIGTYRVQVTNIFGCTSEMIIEVTASGPPLADAGNDRSLGCDGTALLEAVSNMTADALTYTWTRDQDVEFNEESQNILISEPGIYLLEVFNEKTGCRSNDQVSISNALPNIDYKLEFTECNFEQGLFIIPAEQQVFVSSIVYGENNYSASDEITVQEVSELTIIKSDGCEEDIELSYILNEELTIEFILPEDIIAGETFELQADVNRLDREIASIEWISEAPIPCADCLNQTLTMGIPTALTLVITDIYGCQTSEEIVITPEVQVRTFVPTAFSPNDDGINDRLEIFHNEHVASITSFKIFNRWGERMFSLENDTAGSLPASLFSWDGTISGGKFAPEGVYVYSAVVSTIGGEEIIVSGSFALMR